MQEVIDKFEFVEVQGMSSSKEYSNYIIELLQKNA